MPARHRPDSDGGPPTAQGLGRRAGLRWRRPTELAKQGLDELVTTAVSDSRQQCEVQRVSVKSPESTRRKASRFCGGDVRKVADMARVTVICDTPEALKQAYSAIMGSLQVSGVSAAV